MRRGFRNEMKWSDVTPKADWLNRRQLMAGWEPWPLPAPAMAKIAAVPSKYSTDADQNSLEDITSYNNFYEFGIGQGRSRRNMRARLTTDPWSVQIDGLVDKPGSYDLGDILGGVTLEERIYRFRCVEAWSMVVPWIGFELATLLNRVGVQPGAKFVAFETLVRPEEMPGQKSAHSGLALSRRLAAG